MWKELLTEASAAMPDFNDKLLLNFREDKIAEIPNYLDVLFRQSIAMLHNPSLASKPKLEYISFSEMTPEERIDNFRQKSVHGKKFDIRTSNLREMKYIFRFEDELFEMIVDVPFIDNHAILIEGIDYYPLLAIVEKGGMYRFDTSEVVLQVMRARLKFWRNERGMFKTVDGNTYRDENITCKLHQASGGKRRRPPLIIYHLVKFAFSGTMQYYGVGDQISLVQSDIIPSESGYKFVPIEDKIFIRVLEEDLKSQYIRRIIVGLCSVYSSNRGFTFEDANSTVYYKITLGKLTYPSVKKTVLLLNNAENHLQMNETMLDPAAMHQHRSIGIDAKDLEHLLLLVFQNIDVWLKNYQPHNLYDKKIGSLDQMMAGLVRNFNTKLFKIVNSKQGLTRESVKSLMQATRRSKWISTSTMFRSKPIVYNDNWLLTVGAKRFRSMDNTEIADGSGGGASLSPHLLRAHPSQLVVESALCFPSSSPVVSGSINPYLEIDVDGSIITPTWSGEIEHVFDT